MTPPPLLLHVFPSFAIGGAQARFVTLANRFGARYRHAIVAMDGDLSCASRLDPALDVSYPTIALRKGNTLGNLGRVRAALRTLRPALLVTSNWGSIEWAMANAVPGTRPIVPHLHMEDGFGPDERDRQLRRRVWLRRVVLRRSLVMLPSQTLARIATAIWRLDSRRLRYIPNGIDLEHFRPRAATVAPRDGVPVPVIGTIAGLRAEKNVARLIRAFALLRAAMPARLVVVGDGPERARLAALAGELGVAADVAWRGHVEDPAPVYGELDVFALASDTEQMPISILEAMAAGLPVAATAVGDIAAMLAPENLPYLAERDDRALADKLRLLVGDADLRRRLGALNRARAERDFDVVQMVSAHAALLDEARA